MKNTEETEVTQVRRRVPTATWTSRTKGEIVLPPPGPGPEPEFMDRLRAAFAESERILSLKPTGSR